MQNKRQEGAFYEEKAAGYLEMAGYRILDRNYRRKTGEIDLIAAGKGYLVFVEVKYRKDRDLGLPEEAVTRNKQGRIFRTAQWYMKEKHIAFDTPCRFDVIAVEGAEGEEIIRHIENAYGM